MSAPCYQKHLLSNKDRLYSACGVYRVPCVAWKSRKQVTCKNCMSLIERNVETVFYRRRRKR